MTDEQFMEVFGKLPPRAFYRAVIRYLAGTLDWKALDVPTSR